MPIKEKKYHYFYKTTCLITNRYYYGIHSTDNLDDGYIGSGKRLWYSINKHGRENHKIEILEFFDTRENLKKREKEVVNEELLKDIMCMNLQPGGGGGWINEEHKIKNIAIFCEAGRIAIEKKRKIYPEWWENVIEKRVNTFKLNTNKKENNYWSGKTHSETTKQKMKKTHKANKHQQGDKNSQYGTCWITNGKENIKVKKGDIIPDGWNLGRSYPNK